MRLTLLTCLFDFRHFDITLRRRSPSSGSCPGIKWPALQYVAFPECSPCAGQVSHTCPLCATKLREQSALWHHLNVEHISRHSFPSAGFLEDHGRNFCFTRGFIYARRWKFCRRTQGTGKPCCRGWIIAPSESEFVSLTSSPHKSVTGYVSVHESSNASVLVPPILVTEVENDVTVNVEDLALEGVKAASNLDCQSGLNEADVFQTIMDKISTLSVTSVCYLP